MNHFKLPKQSSFVEHMGHILPLLTGSDCEGDSNMCFKQKANSLFKYFENFYIQQIISEAARIAATFGSIVHACSKDILVVIIVSLSEHFVTFYA
jgi:hypothetical protein